MTLFTNKMQFYIAPQVLLDMVSQRTTDVQFCQLMHHGMSINNKCIKKVVYLEGHGVKHNQDQSKWPFSFVRFVSPEPMCSSCDTQSRHHI